MSYPVGAATNVLDPLLDAVALKVGNITMRMLFESFLVPTLNCIVVELTLDFLIKNTLPLHQ